jgi:all-trans-retinol 13,14-reductase
MSRYDVILIGSGMSSLTSAALLSKKGKSVLVLEQHTKVGGYMHCFSRFGDRFDTGAHYVGAMDAGQPFHTLLNYLDVYDSELFVPLNPEGFDVFRFPEFETKFPKGYDAVIAKLSDQFPHEAIAIKKYFSKIQEVVAHFPTYEFSEDTDMNVMAAAIDTPLTTVVESLTSNRALQCVFYSYCTLHAVDPEDVSFGMHAIVTDSLIRGPHGFARGGDALAQKFVQVIQKNGGRVLTKKRVMSIENNGKLANAVITSDGERFESDWVISGVHPKRTVELVTDQSVFSPAFRQRLAKLKESVGIFGLYASCHTSPDIDPLRNYYYFSTSDPGTFLKSGELNASASPIFLASAARGHGQTRNAFTLNLYAASPISWFDTWRDTCWGKRPEEYEAAKSEYAEQLFNRVEQYQPGFRSTIDKSTSSSPITNLHYNGSPEGSAYGLYHSIENGGARSLGPRSHIANLLLTGQSCLFPGLLGAAVSALRTSGHILGIKPILRELREQKQSL